MLFAHVRNMLLAILNCSAQFKIVRNLRLPNLPCEKQKSYIAFKLFWKNAGKLFLTSFLVDSIQHFAWISSFLCVLQVLSILKFAFKKTQQNSSNGKNYRVLQYVQHHFFHRFLHRFSYIQIFLETFSNTHIEMLVERLRMYVQSELINCSNNFGFLLFIGPLIWIRMMSKN